MVDEVVKATASSTPESTILKLPLVELSPFEMLSSGPIERKNVIIAPVVVKGPLLTLNSKEVCSVSPATWAKT